MGTKVSTQTDFSSNTNATVKVDFTVPGVAKFEAGASGPGYQNVSSDSTSQTVSKGQSVNISVLGNGDGVDHTQDAFILLLNPAVAVEETQQIVNGQCGSVVAHWYLGLSGSAGTEQWYVVYVEWLKDPSLIPKSVAQQLQALGFTTADYQTILSLDPFWNGSTQIDGSRFIPTINSFPYEPPLQKRDCNDGVCSCLSLSSTITNQFETDVQKQSQRQYSVDVTVKASDIDLSIFSAEVSAEEKLTWTSTSTNDNIISDSQSATATVVCPSATYQGPTTMTIYWDTLFGSFVFVPTVLTPQMMILSQGFVTDILGRSVAHEPVTLSIGRKTYHTWTNNRGEYVFFTPAHRGVFRLPASGQVLIRGKGHVITVPSAHKLHISVP